MAVQSSEEGTRVVQSTDKLSMAEQVTDKGGKSVLRMRQGIGELGALKCRKKRERGGWQ